MTAETQTVPQLRFRLQGEWHPLVLPGYDESALRAQLVRDVGGVHDAQAPARALLSEQLRKAAKAADEGQAQAMFVCTQLRPGIPMPINLTVFERPDLHMSPAVGTSPDVVMDLLEQAFALLEMDDLDTATRVEGAGFLALRIHRIQVDEVDMAGEVYFDRSLVADYWYTVPGTKNVLLVNFITPMGDIPNVMLQFFDAIVKASYFEMPEAAESEEAESVET